MIKYVLFNKNYKAQNYTGHTNSSYGFLTTWKVLTNWFITMTLLQ